MRRQVGVFVAACFYYSGLVKLARWWTQRSGPRLIILTYHRASGGDLRHHLLYLRRHYRMLHLEEALEELYTPSKDGEDRCDRRTPLVLAFDDGYRDNYTHAFALACELQIPITIFLIPGYVESGDYFWWQEGKRLAQHSQVDKVTVEGRTHQLDQPEERNTLAGLRYARWIGVAGSHLVRTRCIILFWHTCRIRQKCSVRWESAVPFWSGSWAIQCVLLLTPLGSLSISAMQHCELFEKQVMIGQ